MMRWLIARWRARRWRRLSLRQRCLAVSIGKTSAMLVLLVMGGAAYSQSGTVTGVSGSMLVSNGSNWVTVVDTCDTNDRTPVEALDCKLDAWRKKLDSAQKRRAEADADITKAQERISAFTDAKRGR